MLTLFTGLSYSVWFTIVIGIVILFVIVKVHASSSSFARMTDDLWRSSKRGRKPENYASQNMFTRSPECLGMAHHCFTGTPQLLHTPQTNTLIRRQNEKQ